MLVISLIIKCVFAVLQSSRVLLNKQKEQWIFTQCHVSLEVLKVLIAIEVLINLISYSSVLWGLLSFFFFS